MILHISIQPSSIELVGMSSEEEEEPESESSYSGLDSEGDSTDEVLSKSVLSPVAGHVCVCVVIQEVYEAEALQDDEDESGAESTGHVTASWREAEETDTSDEEVWRPLSFIML